MRIYIKTIILLYLTLVLFGCQKDNPDSRLPVASAPFFSPPARSFTDTQDVEILSNDVHAQITYTINGSDPTPQSAIYGGVITLTQTTTIRARAFLVDHRPSPIVSATYTLQAVNNPTFSLPAGTYYTDQVLTITSTTQNAEIYFTINGVEPTQNPLFLYTGPINLPHLNHHTAHVQARAFRSNFAPSEIVSRTYFFIRPSMIEIPGGHLHVSLDWYLVLLSDFTIGNYPVTQEQWTEVMEGNPNGIEPNPSTFDGNRFRPVENVSWFDAIVFCNRLSLAEGLEPVYTLGGNSNSDQWGLSPTEPSEIWDGIILDMSRNGYRLPTEIEWLFAANERRLHLEKTYSGSFFINDVAWYLSNSNSTTHPVAGKQGNSLGLFDMSGNVWEWIWDWSSTSFPNINAVDPTGPANPPASGSYRVQRGGSYMTEEQRCRLDHRGNAAPHVRRSDSGFRIVRRGDISER